MHMCPQDIENSSPRGTEIKLHKVKKKIILAICYWLKIISHSLVLQYGPGRQGKYMLLPSLVV